MLALTMFIYLNCEISNRACVMNGEPIFLEVQKFFNPRESVGRIASSDVVSCRQTHMVHSVLEAMLKSGVTRMPVTTKDMKLVGMISATDILDFLGGGPKYKVFVMNKRKTDQYIRKLMTRDPRTINRTHSVSRVIAEFKKHRHGAMPILHRGTLSGMISEWDLAMRIREPLGIDVGEIMIRKPIVAREKFTIEEVAKMMCRGGFRNLPVTDKNIYLGMAKPIDILSYLHKNSMLYKLRKAKRKVTKAINTEQPIAKPGHDIYEAVLLMKRHNTSALPVVEDHELVGILTARDLVDAMV